MVHKAKDLVYADFNQDFSCIIVGTTRGFCIYNCEPLSKCYNQGIILSNYFNLIAFRVWLCSWGL